MMFVGAVSWPALAGYLNKPKKVDSSFFPDGSRMTGTTLRSSARFSSRRRTTCLKLLSSRSMLHGNAG